MYSSFHIAKKYLGYYLTALNGRGHGMHSPFVFDFISNVLNNGNQYPYPEQLERLRKKLLDDHAMLETVDHGAGSRKGNAGEKPVSAVAGTALKPKKFARLLYRLVKHYHPQTVVELGTSLGITTAYLALAAPAAEIITIEGSAAIAQKAKENFEQLKLNNIRAIQGNFDTVLPALLAGIDTVDLAFIDGNHRLEPTLDYFHQLLQKTNRHSILVFDDIHWSADMEKAWKAIQDHPSVHYTIDLFFMGFVFFRDEFKVKQHFVIRF